MMIGHPKVSSLDITLGWGDLQLKLMGPWYPGAEPVRHLLPPQHEKVFKYRNNAVRYLEAVALYQGYSISSRSSKGVNGQNPHYYCTRGHQKPQRAAKIAKARSQAIRKGESHRKSSTSKTGCSFSVSLNFLQKKSIWKVRVQNGGHNHKPFDHPNDIPKLCRFTKPKLELIEHLSNANVPPNAIRTLLPGESSNRPMRDIYNAKLLARRSELGGQSPIAH